MASENKNCTSDICQTIPSMIKSVLIAFAKPYQKQTKTMCFKTFLGFMVSKISSEGWTDGPQDQQRSKIICRFSDLNHVDSIHDKTY